MNLLADRFDQLGNSLVDCGKGSTLVVVPAIPSARRYGRWFASGWNG